MDSNSRTPQHKSWQLGGLKRRDFIYTGFVGALGLTLGDFFRLQSARAEMKTYESKEGPAKSIIHIFLPGGVAQQETWDPKPVAPLEYRGPCDAINTKIDGVQFSQHLSKTAQIADKLCIIRSMTHGEADHGRGTHNMFTGYRPSPALQYPSMGSVVSHEFGSRRNLPPYVCIPNQPNEFAGSGYLSSAFGPFSLGADPGNKNFRVRDLSLPQNVTPERFARRQNYLEAVDSHFRYMEKSDALNAMDSFYQRAYALISSPEAREAFNIGAENEETRNLYGQHDAGMRLLMARRLVESGVRFVSVTYGGWDHHQKIREEIGKQLPPFDQAFAGLITDLERRGMLDSTLVMVSSEFGRTPKINKDSGRDHWPKVFSVVLAGGGMKKGVAYGMSDATATEPDQDPVSVQDLATTVYNRLGIVADKELMAPGNRPIEIVDNGHVLRDIIV